jgi:hypothetical protein
MKDRKKLIKRAAAVVALFVLLTMSFSFLANGGRVTADNAYVEALYGRADFGGNYSWMGNVKRPGDLSRASIGQPIDFDLSQDDGLDDMINPNNGLQSLAAVIPSSPISGYRSFDDQNISDNLIKVEQVHLGEIPISYSGDDDNDDNSYAGFVNIPKIIDANEPSGDGGNWDNPNPNIVVPAPAAAILAAIGIAGVSAIRKK